MSSDDILYHYTSNEAFLKIIEGKSFRLSSLENMNDAREGDWISNRCLEEVKGTLGNLVGPVTKVFEEYRVMHPFLAACLSKEGDILSQWRAYASDGQGVSIGFCRAGLKKVSMKQGPDFDRDLVDIKYDDDHQRQYIETYRKYVEHCLEDVPKCDAINQQLIIQDLATNLLYKMYEYKNPAFREEQEVRILMQMRHDLNMFVGSSMWTEDIKMHSRLDVLTPFYDLDLSTSFPELIKKIILGPKNNSNLSHIKRWLAKTGFQNVEVTKSSASYR